MKNIKKSLHLLKADLTLKETILKTIQKEYPQLSTFSEEELLSYFQFTTIDELKEYIQETNKMSPINETHSGLLCNCKDSNGKLKDHYNTYQDAQQQADVMMIDQKVKLRVYRCPYGYGCHLTKG